MLQYLGHSADFKTNALSVCTVMSLSLVTLASAGKETEGEGIMKKTGLFSKKK